MTLDGLLSRPRVMGNPKDGRGTFHTRIAPNVFHVAAKGEVPANTVGESDLIYAAQGTIDLSIGEERVSVPKGYAFLMTGDGTYQLPDGGEVVLVRATQEADLVLKQGEVYEEGKPYETGGHTDVRRAIGDTTNRVKYFEVAPDARVELGHHHHQGFDELFHCVEGGFDIHFEHPETKEGGVYRVEAGQQVKVPLGIAHLVVSDPGMRMVNVCSRPFERSDLNPYQVTLQTTRLG